VASIRDLSKIAAEIGQPPTTWRDQLLPARFRNASFHVESGSKENGRRIVTHQFPKKEVPYSEDMGRQAKTFSVRAYCIVFPYDTNIDLYKRDYRIARDALINALELIGPGELQMPTFPKSPIYVVVTKYRVSEEERIGGYCAFDISFTEFGFAPSRVQPQDPTAAIMQRSEAMRKQVKAALDSPSPRFQRIAASRITGPRAR
jgi:prophage DNA circulation protein